MKNESPCLERDHRTEAKKTYQSRSDHKCGHWESPHPVEAYDGMMLQHPTWWLFSNNLCRLAGWRSRRHYDKALTGFLRSVQARVVDQSGGLFIKPSSFDFQLKILLKFLDSLVRDGSVVDWDTLTEHVLKYRSSDYWLLFSQGRKHEHEQKVASIYFFLNR